MPGLYNQSVTVVRAPALKAGSGADAAQRDWTAATRTVVQDVLVQPVQAAETGDSAAVSTNGTWRISNQPGAGRLDLLSTDRVEYDGLNLAVDGPPEHWPSPGGGGWHHTEAVLVLEPLTRAGAAGGAASAVRVAATGAASRAWSPS